MTSLTFCRHCSVPGPGVLIRARTGSGSATLFEQETVCSGLLPIGEKRLKRNISCIIVLQYNSFRLKLNFRFLCITVLPQLCFLSHKFAFFAYCTIGNCIFQVASIVSFLLNFFSPKRNVFRKHPGVGVGVWVCVGVCVCVCVGYVCVCVCGLNNAYLQISIKQFSSCLYVCTSEVRVGPPPGYFNYCTTKKLD